MSDSFLCSQNKAFLLVISMYFLNWNLYLHLKFSLYLVLKCAVWGNTEMEPLPVCRSPCLHNAAMVTSATLWWQGIIVIYVPLFCRVWFRKIYTDTTTIPNYVMSCQVNNNNYWKSSCILFCKGMLYHSMVESLKLEDISGSHLSKSPVQAGWPRTGCPRPHPDSF